VAVCPHCGAENADWSDFCSLCLARFSGTGKDGRTSMQGTDPGPAAAEGGLASERGPMQQPVQEYVSPGDYRALANEMARNQPPYGEATYYGAALGSQGVAPRFGTQARTQQLRAMDVILMLLSYSFLTFIILFVCRLAVGIFLLGALFGNSDAGLSIGTALFFVSDALLLALGGYLISAKALQRNRGWLIGLGCAACVVFVWQPLTAMILILLLTGEAYVPLFNLVGILFTLFLELPMGALGGWLAEKKYLG